MSAGATIGADRLGCDPAGATVSVLTVDAYREIRSRTPGYAALACDDLHRWAASGSRAAADTLAALVDADPWWSRPILVAPATDALTAAAGRRALFDAEAA